MITITGPYAAANVVSGRMPIYIAQFAGLTQAYSTSPVLLSSSGIERVGRARPVVSQYRTRPVVHSKRVRPVVPNFFGTALLTYYSSDFMQLPQTTTPSQLYPDRGQSSVGSVQFDIEDIQGNVTSMLTNGLLYGTIATLKMGFASIGYSDYATVFTGIVTGCVLGALSGGTSLTSYTITLSDPAVLTNRQIFNPASSALSLPMLIGDTTMDVFSTVGFLSSGYVIVDSEIIQYSGITSGGVQPNTAGADLNGVAFGVGVWVAVGAKGNIFTSSDGKVWVRSNSQTSFDLYGVCFGNGLFVTVGDNGTIMTSVDGMVWVVQTGIGTASLKGVVWADGAIAKYVIVAVNQVQYSSNAVSWTAATAATSDSWKVVAYSPDLGQLCAGASTTNNLMTSTDAITWTLRTGASYSTRTDGIAWSHTALIWAAAGDTVSDGVHSTTQHSTDGITWSYTSSVQIHDLISGMTYDPVLNLFIACRTPSAVFGVSNAFSSSPDGLTWLNIPTPVADWSAVASNGAGMYVAVSATNSGVIGELVTSSTDGITFTTYISQLTGLTRGVLRSAAAPHNVNAGAGEMIRLGPAHPIDIALGILQNTNKTGVAMPASLLNATGIAALKPTIGLSCMMDFRINAAWNAKDFLEQQIYQVLALFPITSNGQYSIGQLFTLISSVMSILHDNILDDPSGGEPNVGLDTNWSASIINQVQMNSDYDVIADKFYTSITYTDVASIAKYGILTIPPIQSLGIRSELSGGAVAASNAMRTGLFAIFGGGAALIYSNTFMATNIVELGDVVDITSSLLPNLSIGVRGVFGELMLVVNRQILFDQGYVAIQALQPLP